MTKARFENMGERLRELRDRAGLTQEALAHRAGVSAASIFRIEQGRPSDPKLSTLVALAEALGLTVGSLADELVREGPPPEKPKRKGKGKQ
jgi:transcriptional regulator with XRE-family HTH domain